MPYVRVHDIRIDHATPGVAMVVYRESEAIKTADGSVRKLKDLPYQYFNVTPADMAVAMPVVDPVTGLQIEDRTVTYQDVYLGMLAVLRSQQIKREQQ